MIPYSCQKPPIFPGYGLNCFYLVLHTPKRVKGEPKKVSLTESVRSTPSVCRTPYTESPTRLRTARLRPAIAKGSLKEKLSHANSATSGLTSGNGFPGRGPAEVPECPAGAVPARPQAGVACQGPKHETSSRRGNFP